MAARKSWTEKLHNGRAPEVVTITKGYAGIPAGTPVLIPTPLQVREYIRTLPSGVTVPPTTLRTDLARDAGAATTCPLCTGIFLRIVAEASLEAGDDVPFWRVIDPASPLARKLSCGAAFVSQRREAEMNPAQAAGHPLFRRT